MDELEVYKELLREMGISGKEMADELGVSYGSYRAMTRSGAKKVPKWVKSFLFALRRSV